MRVKSLSTAEGRETSAAARHGRCAMATEHTAVSGASEVKLLSQMLAESLVV